MRVSPYEFKNLSQELIDFKDEITSLINQGKYQNRVIIEGTPTWTGQEGETVYSYITSATAGEYDFYTYYYVNSGWKWVVYHGAT